MLPVTLALPVISTSPPKVVIPLKATSPAKSALPLMSVVPAKSALPATLTSPPTVVTVLARVSIEPTSTSPVTAVSAARLEKVLCSSPLMLATVTLAGALVLPLLVTSTAWSVALPPLSDTVPISPLPFSCKSEPLSTVALPTLPVVSLTKRPLLPAALLKDELPATVTEPSVLTTEPTGDLNWSVLLIPVTLASASSLLPVPAPTTSATGWS